MGIVKCLIELDQLDFVCRIAKCIKSLFTVRNLFG